MTEGPQALTTQRIAMQFEVAGERGTTPTVYMITDGKITPTSTKKSSPKRVSGNRDPVMSTRGVEEFKISIPLPALVEDNGLGNMLLALFGTDTTGNELGSSTAYDHVFTANDTIKSFTLWLYDTIHPQSIRLCVVDSAKMVWDREKGISFTFDCIGADLVESETWGTQSFINVATDKPKLIPPGQSILELGEPQSCISQYWETVTITSKEGAKFGAPGKGAAPAGSSSPKLVVKGDRDFTIDVEFIDIDGMEVKRFRQGGDAIATATAQADVQALTKFRLRSFGNQTKASTSAIWGYAHQNNVGTVVATFGGTYTAGLSNTPAAFEIKCTTAAGQDKFKWRKDGGAWSAEVSTALVGAPITLSDGVTVYFGAVTGMTLNDTYYGFTHYQRMIEAVSPSNVIDDVNYKDSSDFYRATEKLYHESGPGGTKPSMTLRNTKTSAYA